MEQAVYKALLDSINSPIVFVDNDHVIRYLNKTAQARYYEGRGYAELIGKSLFDCHNPASAAAIRALHDRLLAGENEVFLKENKYRERITVVAVRSPEGQLLGYYELFEPVAEQSAPADVTEVSR